MFLLFVTSLFLVFHLKQKVEELKKSPYFIGVLSDVPKEQGIKK